MSRVVKEHIGVIILGVFIVVAVIAPACCIIWARRREHRKYHPSSKSFRKARGKLATVAEYRKDTEKCLGGGDAEWTGNCPICIGSLTAETSETPAENATTTTGTTPLVAGSSAQDGSGSSKEMAAVATASTAQPQSGGTAGGAATAEASSNKSAGGCSDLLAITRWLPLRLKRCKNQPERDVEIMKLKGCGHWFHVRCLASWFLIDRYDCPVCRKIYFDGKPKSQLSTWLQTNYNITTARVGAAVMV